MKILIYVLYYDSYSYAYTIQHYNHLKDILQPLSIISTKYLENILFLEYLPTHSEAWISCDYVGSLSCIFNKKMNPNFLYRFINSKCTSDVIYFLDYGIKTNVINHSERCHPGFQNAWVSILTKAGFSTQDILKYDMPFMASNYWVAKPEWMKKYIIFLQKITKLISEDPDLQRKLDINARYYTGKIPRHRLLMIFNKPYYTLHPFIFERLPGFFFHHYKASIQHFY